jgi:hypothetical protein
MSTDTLVEQVVTICRAALRDDTVEAGSDLWLLGVTSLSALRIRAQIRAELGRDPELGKILENLSPAALADVVAAAPPWIDDEDDL